MRGGKSPKPRPQRASVDSTAAKTVTSPPSTIQTTEPNHLQTLISALGSPSHNSGEGTSSEAIRKVSLFHKQGASYGPTHLSAVFSENQNTFASAIQDVVEPSARSMISSPNQGVDAQAEPLKELAIETLLSFPSRRTCEALLQDIGFIHDVWISPTMIRRCLSQVWGQYGENLHGHSRESVWEIAKDLHENGKHPVPSVEAEKESKWANWFSGPNLRWEMIGIIFSWAGMAFKRKQDWDHIFSLPEQQERDRRTTADKMRECALACLKFSQEFPEISDIKVCLMKNTVKLQSIIFSDECDQLRIGFGTACSAFVTDGLHRLPKYDKVTPISQYRSSLSASMYSCDKRESLFNGRPPMLNRPYCHCPLPLDLHEEDIYGGPERLAIAVSRLCPGGWNTDGKIYTATWARADCLLAPIREGILKLALSVEDQFSKAEVETLIVRLKEIVKSFPPQLQYKHKTRWSPTTGFGPSDKYAEDAFIVARMHLDVLQCHFLMQRLMVSQGFNGQELFDTAQETMDVILSIWSNRDQLQKFYFAFDWIIVSFGIPAAGILCIELLCANSIASSGMAAGSQSQTHINVSRSKIVQSLVMFIAFLDWARPTDNNAELCWRFRDVIKRIIDKTFDPPRSVPIQQQNLQPTLQLPSVEAMEQPVQTATPTSMDFIPDFSTPWTVTDDLDWLASVDWTQGDWLDPSR
ncbi:hypothetical protein IFR05_000583 [Cadophora sp. M221]|nr:hypothetical protein IFR05_000583 [Cadophora sp. M221]